MPIERILGLTPTFKRLAWSYAKKGVGSHPSDSPEYDEVRVRELYEWHSPTNAMPPQGGLIVEFFWLGERLKWVEFGCHFIGGGGTPFIAEVK
jgi:hypothetical protein